MDAGDVDVNHWTFRCANKIFNVINIIKDIDMNNEDRGTGSHMYGGLADAIRCLGAVSAEVGIAHYTVSRVLSF
jgi:hypothetical protein